MKPPGISAQIELVFIVLACLGAYAARDAGLLPGVLGVGALCLTVAATLLGQGLIRDLVTLWRARGAKNAEGPALMCLCLESTAGMAGIVAGSVLMLGGIGGVAHLSTAVWTLGLFAVLITGLGIRDWVLQFKPLQIVHIPDHGSVKVTFK